MYKKILFIILALITLALASCSPAMRAEAPAAPAMGISEGYGGDFTQEIMLDREAVEVEKAANIADSTTTGTIERMVIKNADLSIVVNDPLQKLDAIAAMADEMGGYVVDSNAWQTTLNSGAKVPHATITIRVPAERLEDALERIKSDEVEIISENVSGQDVTSEYTDLESRLRNLETAESQLQKIMGEAKEIDDVLKVYNNLVSVREQIEVIKGQMKYYKDASRLSRIRIDISGDEEAQPLQIGTWRPAGVAKDAIETMINVLQTLGDIAIWLLLCVLPIGVILGIPLFFVVRYIQRLRKRNKAEKDTKKQNTPNDLESSARDE